MDPLENHKAAQTVLLARFAYWVKQQKTQQKPTQRNNNNNKKKKRCLNIAPVPHLPNFLDPRMSS